jgi:transcriptional regulator with XRE-family HTH domain
MLPHIAVSNPVSTTPRFRKVVGESLRNARRRRGFTLRDVAELSGGQFKPSGLGGYERGERAISLERFWSLASLYAIPADELLREALDKAFPEARPGVILDLSRLELLHGEESRLMADLADAVSAQRAERPSESIALRSADVRALALRTKLSPADLIRRLEPALREPAQSES